VSRFVLALIIGLLGTALIAGLQFGLLAGAPQVYLPLFVGPLAGIVAAILSVRSPKKAGKGGGEGALTGLLTGVVVLVGGMLVGIFYMQLEPFDKLIRTQGFTLNPGQTQATVRIFLTIGVGFVYLLAGLVGMGLAAGLGAVAGGMAKQRTSVAEPITQ
jgi:hypothetical protein